MTKEISNSAFLDIGKSFLELGALSYSAYVKRGVNIAPIERRVYYIFETWRSIKDSNFDINKLQEKLKVSDVGIYSFRRYLISKKFVSKINSIYATKLSEREFIENLGKDFWENPHYRGRKKLWLLYSFVKKKRLARTKDLRDNLRINKVVWGTIKRSLLKLDAIKLIGKGNWYYVYHPSKMRENELKKIKYKIFNHVEEKTLEIVTKTKGISSINLQKELSKKCGRNIDYKTVIMVIENLEMDKRVFCFRLRNKPMSRRFARLYIFPMISEKKALFRVLFALSQGHKARKRIYDSILNRPGISIQELVDTVKIWKMGIYRHIRILEKYKLIKSRNFDHKIRLYPHNYFINITPKRRANGLRIPHINEIAESRVDNISAKSLSKILKINSRYCRSILNELCELGLAERLWKGNNWIYSIDNKKIKQYATNSEVMLINGRDFEDTLKKELEKRFHTDVDCRTRIPGLDGWKCEVDLSIKGLDIFIECKASTRPAELPQKNITELVGRMLSLRPKSRWILAVLGAVTNNGEKIAKKWGIEIVASQERKILIEKLAGQIKKDSKHLIQRRLEIIGDIVGKNIAG